MAVEHQKGADHAPDARVGEAVAIGLLGRVHGGRVVPRGSLPGTRARRSAPRTGR